MRNATPHPIAFGLLACLLLSPISSLRAAPVSLPGGRKIEKVDFERHIAGLLGRAGCSAGACHGSFQGKGGFYLSLFGYSAEKDYQAIARDNLGRRINLVDPDQSLLLLKATGAVQHGGGRRFDRNSPAYRLIREWIANGARYEPGSGTVKRVEVTPKEQMFEKPGQKARLKVMVEFADGSREDLSYFSEFRVNNDYVAEINRDGEVTGLRPGDTSVVVTYRGNVVSGRALVPVAVPKDFKYPKISENN
ncbi:MAG: Ig domain-containing protein, partial [Thermomicrobiales bacterium]